MFDNWNMPIRLELSYNNNCNRYNNSYCFSVGAMRRYIAKKYSISILGPFF
jgi:hypothetical protein